MKVNRVFCFSKEVAKQNKNNLPIIQIVLISIFFIIAMITLPFKYPIVLSWVFVGIILYYAVIIGLRLNTKRTGFAITKDNRIFKVIALNNVSLYIGSIAVGKLADRIISNDQNIGENLGTAVGSAAMIYDMNQKAQYMSHPEIIARIVESAPNITGAEVIEILNVYSIKESKHTIKINCDYKVLRTNKIKCKKNMHIEKSYNQLNDLVSLLYTYR